MPMHDWTRVPAGVYHDFHQDWATEIRRTLNRGVLPPGYFAMADQKVSGPEPDVVALQLHRPRPNPPAGGLAVADAPPAARLSGRGSIERAVYARKATRLVVRNPLGQVVAMIELLSPGNKDSTHAVRSFVGKVLDFLNARIHVLLVDPFPPTPRDPDGIHQVIWDELVGEPFPQGPAEQPLAVIGYEAGDPVTAYVNPFAVGEPVPDAPLFLAPGWYVNVPLERTYAASWAETPQPLRELVEPAAP